MIALGGSATSTYGSSFFGWSAGNNTGFLYRNSADGGKTFTGLASVAGLKAFGMIHNTTANTYTYYDNSTTPVSSAYVSGTYQFGKIGNRDYLNNPNSQASTGFLGDVVVFNRVLTNTEAATVMTALKAKYNIT